MPFAKKEFKKTGRFSSDDRGSSRRPTSGYSNERELTKAICDSCGASCHVPFRPATGKPVYCNECFGKNRPARPDSGRPGADRYDSRRNESDNRSSRYSDRPSYGSDNRGSEYRGSEQRSSSTAGVSKELAQINAKLDKILSLLEDDH